MLEKETKIAKGLAGRVTRGKIVPEDSIEDESVTFWSGGVLDWWRKSFVVDETNSRSRNENASSFRVFRLVVLGDGDSC